MTWIALLKKKGRILCSFIWDREHGLKYFSCTLISVLTQGLVHTVYMFKGLVITRANISYTEYQIELDLDLAQILEAYDSSWWNRRKTKRLDQSVVSAQGRHLFPRSPLQSNIIYICWGESPQWLYVIDQNLMNKSAVMKYMMLHRAVLDLLMKNTQTWIRFESCGIKGKGNT